MSLVTDLVEGKISPATFISGAAADLKKDAGIFADSAIGRDLLTWAVSAIIPLLASHLSPTTIALIQAGLEEALGLTAAPEPVV